MRGLIEDNLTQRRLSFVVQDQPKSGPDTTYSLSVPSIETPAPGELIQDANDSHTPDTIACTLPLADADREKRSVILTLNPPVRWMGKGEKEVK